MIHGAGWLALGISPGYFLEGEDDEHDVHQLLPCSSNGSGAHLRSGFRTNDDYFARNGHGLSERYSLP